MILCRIKSRLCSDNINYIDINNIVAHILILHLKNLIYPPELTIYIHTHTAYMSCLCLLRVNLEAGHGFIWLGWLTVILWSRWHLLLNAETLKFDGLAGDCRVLQMTVTGNVPSL